MEENKVLTGKKQKGIDLEKELAELEKQRKKNNVSRKEQNRINLQNELVELKEQVKTETDAEELKLMERRMKFIESILEPRPSEDSLLLPEYREGGYFTSPEFKEIEEKVDNLVFAMDIERDMLEEAKKGILKDLYDIDWKPSYERFIPGTIVIRD